MFAVCLSGHKHDQSVDKEMTHLLILKELNAVDPFSNMEECN